MDTVEVTLNLERPVAKRQRDPGERARYEAFLGLVARAANEADIAEAIALFVGSPDLRQRRLRGMFAETRADARAAGLTQEDVERELAAWKQEPFADRPTAQTATVPTRHKATPRNYRVM